MIRPRPRVLLAGLLAASVGLPARAAEVVVERCAALDAAALAPALDAELAGHPAPRAPLVVRVTCAADDIASIVVSGAGEPLVRTIDLSDVPPALRPRLVALAAAEGIALVSARAPAPPPPAPAAPLRPGPLPAEPRPPAPVPVVRPARTKGWALAPSLGLRAYGPRFAIAPVVGAEVAWRRASLGGSLLTDDAQAALGDVRLVLATATASWSPLCTAGASVRLCLAGRADLGLAWADGAATSDAGVAHTTWAPYWALGARAALSTPARGTAATFALDVGWAEGLVALADEQEAVRAAGLHVTLSLGVQLWP